MKARGEAMRDRPILFSPSMVREVLAGRKTMTRRLNGLDAIDEAPGEWAFDRWQTYPGGERRAVFVNRDGEPTGIRCPYGAPGDGLWVREAWRLPYEYDGLSGAGAAPFVRDTSAVRYEATDDHDGRTGRYRHARFMPRWASRLSLVVESVRVERVQAISDEDVAREGVNAESVREMWASATKRARRAAIPATDHPDFWHFTTLDLWCIAWCLINGRDSWDANPWCWVVGFRRADDAQLERARAAGGGR